MSRVFRKKVEYSKQEHSKQAYNKIGFRSAATLERNFSFLKVNGIFDKISGIILSKHELYDDEKTGRKPYELLLEVLNNENLPIIADFHSCHNRPMVMPIGCYIEMDSTNKKITLLEDYFG